MNWSATGAILLALAVILGAFGAHGLRDRLDAYRMGVYEKAVFYHFIHAVMLFILSGRSPIPRGPWVSLVMGIAIFSGSLYLLALTNQRWLGAITPLGGLSFIVGWLWLMIAPGSASKRSSMD